MSSSSNGKSISSASKTRNVRKSSSKNGFSYEDRFQKIQGVSSQAAVRSALAQVIQNMPEDALHNFRVQWTSGFDQGEYDVTVIRDRYYSLASEVYLQNDFTAFKSQEYQKKWVLKDAGQQMHQFANIAAQTAKLGNYISIYDLEDGTKMFGHESSFTETDSVERLILNNIELLNDFEHNGFLNINPHDVSSVTYGYAITADGSIRGVTVYETYCHEALKIINRKRRDKVPLKLHPDNFKIAAEFRSKIASKPTLKSGWGCCGGSQTSDDQAAGTVAGLSKNLTTKEALTMHVGGSLGSRTNSLYNKVLRDDISMISFAIFQPVKDGNWMIEIEVYK